jgi:hypothetical protein
MDPTALYYTFSTVAQTLAAGFAVLAAFVLYRLQGMERELLEANAVFARLREYISVPDIWSILTTEGFEALDARMRRTEKERSVHFYGRETLEPPSRAVLLWWPIWRTTVHWLKVSLAVTVGDIAFCFALLPLVPSVAPTPGLAYTLMAVSVVVGAAALLMYARLIHLLLSPTRLSPLPH